MKLQNFKFENYIIIKLYLIIQDLASSFLLSSSIKISDYYKKGGI